MLENPSICIILNSKARNWKILIRKSKNSRKSSGNGFNRDNQAPILLNPKPIEKQPTNDMKSWLSKRWKKPKRHSLK